MNVLDNTLTLNDAFRIIKPLRFNMMFKPVGPVCNLSCNYCYYLDKTRLFYKTSDAAMSEDLLDRLIKEYIEINNNEQIVFDWHGGEPLLLGIDYFKKIVELQNKYKSKPRERSRGFVCFAQKIIRKLGIILLYFSVVA